MSRTKEMALKKEVTPYEKNNLRLSIQQLVNSILPLLLLWAAAYYS
ncbi:fatty acid desaturase, partial [Paenibacillus tundrae]|nr:fatty acid desaturase [Paenibacillus tundrae]